MTDRDKKVVEFIEKCSCYSNTIQGIFYPSQRVTNRRLAWLHEQGYIKRTRDSAAEHYFYYVRNRCRQKEHFDSIAKTYLWLISNNYKINNFEVQKKYGIITPDMVVDLEREKRITLAVEVELSNNDVNKKIQQYEDARIFNRLLLVSRVPRSSKYINIWNLDLKELP